ncbi:unnamed protein product [Mytilus coruscus]|uniref:C2H2-type domain-containing protein n=1 Tax=Mytilus coruscus TaxID=42192 RepID=A0A6J8EYB8_MYTCO|nr:unnamed protein product [Mytilus coruscus]
MYQAYCKDTAFEPLGRSTLFYILKSCAASKRTNLHGLDNIAAEGVEGYQALHEFTDKLKEINVISTEQHTELNNMLTASKIYMKTDFRLHVQESDMCGDHCIKWSLSDPCYDIKHTRPYSDGLGNEVFATQIQRKANIWFGQKGKNWHVTVCIFKDQENAMKQKTLTHVLDSAKQDWFSVTSLLENVLVTMKEQLPHIKRLCYELTTQDAITVAICGIQIKHYCYSEPQAGKSYCDSKIAHMRTKMKTYVAIGNDIVSASDMKTALDFGIGFNFNEMTELANNKLTEHRSGCIVHEAFKVPSTSTGKIKTVAKNNSNDTLGEACPVENTESIHQDETNTALFFCPEVGCVRKFITYKGMENHVLCGKHTLQLEKKTTYDKIREQWASLCNDVVITCKTLSSPNSSVENTLSCEQMGWALKKGKRTVRFPERVKKILTDKFLDGVKSGKKSNPVEVCEQMKSLRDSV